jgi:hypothetical protein
MNNLITWISVEERLPKHNQTVLIFMADYSTCLEALYSDYSKEFHHPYYGQCEAGYFVDVTHWTPMPEKP